MRPDSTEFQLLLRVSRQTDQGGLCEALLAAVPQLAPGSTTGLFEAFDARGYRPWLTVTADHLVVRELGTGRVVEHEPWLAAAFNRAGDESLVGGVALEVDPACGSAYCFGPIAGFWFLVTVRGRDLDLDTRDRVTCLVTLFANHLTLLDRFERDALTGLLNRQSFDYRFETILIRHRHDARRDRVSDQSWLAIADIDHFKRINDNYGHLFGDEILLLFSRLMRQTFRFDDVLFRYGGEEFVIILNNTSAEGAAQGLERFRQTIEEYNFPTVGRVTTSIGWIGVERDHLPTDLMHKADKALYYAKGAGRNQVVSYEATFGGQSDDVQDMRIDLF
ncbi:MAG: GGDEF domain-containing protein [Gammaproteobacteria bacterium]|nr:GGDEF domain-containing protein [Gammaproteobacteria bacterium]MBI5617524.1 GGDEF domain-containing protein [Gammaproteobacteria bacterium]